MNPDTHGIHLGVLGTKSGGIGVEQMLGIVGRRSNAVRIVEEAYHAPYDNR